MTTQINTLGALRSSGYKPKGIKEELRDNLILKLRSGEPSFANIFGYDDTVIPDLERAILSKHNILLLGLRGQAKTRLARQMVELLDEYIPIISGTEINDDPLAPISIQGKNLVAEFGDKTPIEWMHRSERFVEKLATPDVSIADLIGDIDPIKAASLGLPYSDERVIHFGLVPRAHRSIFVMNELPDLQPRIQVGLFNILQEGDLQIRGFKVRLDLDLLFVFTANPEDYTNRGSIITPLKDRIDSQILTHYALDLEVAKSITLQEIRLSEEQLERVHVPTILENIAERIAFVAREHELIDEKSGVSARLSISVYEALVSTAEHRALKSNLDQTSARISDLWGVVPAITGKVELQYEGEQEGAYSVALSLIGEALKEEFLQHFENPDKTESKENDPFQKIKTWFRKGNQIEILNAEKDSDLWQKLRTIEGLEELLIDHNIQPDDFPFFGELVLHALVEFDVITKEMIRDRQQYRDLLANMLDDINNN